MAHRMAKASATVGSIVGSVLLNVIQLYSSPNDSSNEMKKLDDESCSSPNIIFLVVNKGAP